MLAVRRNMLGKNPNTECLVLIDKAMSKNLLIAEQEKVIECLVDFAETLDLNKDMMFQGESDEGQGFWLQIGVSQGHGFEADLYWHDDEICCYIKQGFGEKKIGTVFGVSAKKLINRIMKMACMWATGVRI
jgi:hypothetical protein